MAETELERAIAAERKAEDECDVCSTIRAARKATDNALRKALDDLQQARDEAARHQRRIKRGG